MGQNYQKIQDVYINMDSSIHEGGFGTIYEGYYGKLQRMVALKKIQKNQNFQREQSILQTITKYKHENIMKFYGSVKSEKGDIYLILELCQGGTLRDYINKGISQWEVLRIFTQIVSAMIFLHQKGIIHRDLKPENILLDFNMNVKIADFGTARHHATKMTANAGTFGYRAPQIIESMFSDTVENPKKYKSKCDVWSVGMILYEMLANEMMENEKGKDKNDKIDIVLDESLSPYWKKLLNQMIVYNEERRWSFEKIQKELNSFKTKMKEQILGSLGYKCENIETNENKKQFQSEQEAKMEGLRFETSVSTLRLSTLWLHFKKDKNIYYSSIMKQLQENETFPLPFLHKTLIKVIAMSLIVKKKSEILIMIKQKKLQIPYGEVNVNSFAEGDDKIFQSLLKTHKIYLQQDVEYWSKKIHQTTQKIPNLHSKHKKSASETDFQRLEGVLKVLQRQVEQISSMEYDRMFSEVCKCTEVNSELAKLNNIEDLRVLASLMLLKNLDREIPDRLFQEENIVVRKKQEIMGMEKEALKQYIVKLKNS